MLIKKDKKDRFKPNIESVVSKRPENFIYIGSKEVDYYINKNNWGLIWIATNNGFYFRMIDITKIEASAHQEAIEEFNRYSLLK